MKVDLLLELADFKIKSKNIFLSDSWIGSIIRMFHNFLKFSKLISSFLGWRLFTYSRNSNRYYMLCEWSNFP